MFAGAIRTSFAVPAPGGFPSTYQFYIYSPLANGAAIIVVEPLWSNVNPVAIVQSAFDNSGVHANEIIITITLTAGALVAQTLNAIVRINQNVF